MKLTLKLFRELTKDFDENATICVPVTNKEWSIKGLPNFIHLESSEHSYSETSSIILGQCKELKEDFVIRELVDKNEWRKLDI